MHMHALAHSLARALTAENPLAMSTWACRLTDSLCHSITHLLTRFRPRSLVHVHGGVPDRHEHVLTRSLTNSLTRPPAHSPTHSLTHRVEYPLAMSTWAVDPLSHAAVGVSFKGSRKYILDPPNVYFALLKVRRAEVVPLHLFTTAQLCLSRPAARKCFLF